jgi:predicted regulator of Ras-like GTPase activity (Roadblock/LC7/MglB family)
LLEADGEAVAWHSADNVELLKLRGAYVAVMLRSCELANRQFQAGAIEHFYVQYAGASFLAQQVGDGYFVVVELNASANLAEALYHIKPFAERVTTELRA